MRQVTLDVETTGLDPGLGHRIIEIGCIEIVEREISRDFQQYFNPQREIDPEALEVHKITLEQLAGQPRFEDCCHRILDFVRGAELVIHNASFDLSFLDAELKLMGRKDFLVESECKVLDTLELARNRHPGLRNNLNALCERYKVQSEERAKGHGALLDARLLAQVYLAMTGGQISIGFSPEKPSSEKCEEHIDLQTYSDMPVIVATPEECQAHERFMQDICKAKDD